MKVTAMIDNQVNCRAETQVGRADSDHSGVQPCIRE